MTGIVLSGVANINYDGLMAVLSATSAVPRLTHLRLGLAETSLTDREALSIADAVSMHTGLTLPS